MINEIYKLKDKLLKFSKADYFTATLFNNYITINYIVDNKIYLLYRTTSNLTGVEFYEFTVRELVNYEVKKSKNVFVL